MYKGRATTNSLVSSKQFPKTVKPMAKMPKGNAGRNDTTAHDIKNM
jgi:hypothetical protein